MFKMFPQLSRLENTTLVKVLYGYLVIIIIIINFISITYNIEPVAPTYVSDLFNLFVRIPA